jgi:sirohydrochlorin cobaltochelatase
MAERTKKTLILLAHGSRSAETAGEMRGLAERIALSRPEFQVRGAFLSLIEPDLPAAVRDAIREGAKEIAVLPLFLFSGKHVEEDIPSQVEALRAAHPDILLSLLPAIGSHPDFPDFLLGMIGAD